MECIPFLYKTLSLLGSVLKNEAKNEALRTILIDTESGSYYYHE